METGLAVVSSIKAIEFFQPGASADVLEKLEIEVRAEAAKLDISTDKGRKAIASLAYKVAKSRTGLDAAGKELVAGEKARLKLIDNERAAVWDRLEALQEEVRKPLTDWEEADKKRVASLEFKVVRIGELGSIPFDATTVTLQERIAELDSIDLSNMQEFTSRTELAEKKSRAALTIALKAIQEREAQAAEMARMRAEQAAREQKERDERIAQEAREKAQREAEAERKRIEEEKFEAEARAKQAEAARVESERLAAIEARAAKELAEEYRVAAEARAKQEAEQAAKRHAEALEAARLKAKAEAEEAERKREEEHRKHEEAIRIAAEKAERDRLAAIEAEREKVAAEARRVEAETKAREKDKAHKAEIHSAAMIAIASIPGIDNAHAKAIVIAIAKGDIPNVKILY